MKIIIDCPERIACDVCEKVCPRQVIRVGESSVNIPRINNGGDCIGCGLCVAQCPGQAIFLLDDHFSESEACITLPYELPETPAIGTCLFAVDNEGRRLGAARVVRVRRNPGFDKTELLEVAVPKGLAQRVRGIDCRA
jgi:NAD-dependent dihydropyrimidine dehydrogenase PreA subunit